MLHLRGPLIASIVMLRSLPLLGAEPAAKPELEVILTEAAAKELKPLMKQTETRFLRLTAPKDAAIKLDLDDISNPKEDLRGESHGITVIADRASVSRLPPGLTIDFINLPNRRGFDITLPSPDKKSIDTQQTLAEARKGFKTALTRRQSGNGESPPKPPADTFRLVKYPSAVGELAAYLTPDPSDGKKHPAIVWITGGDSNTINELWGDQPRSNDQTAAAYRKAGIVLMLPSLRGGNNNPGTKEAFLGEVDDILAAAKYLRSLPYVDPDRVYLGGHSTGGTLALLTAECSNTFRAVFSFGPTDNVFNYGQAFTPFKVGAPNELKLRSPVYWLHGIESPTFVIEGESGNIKALETMKKVSSNNNVRFLGVRGAGHFDVLAPTNELIAGKILRDIGKESSIELTEAELNRAVGK